MIRFLKIVCFFEKKKNTNTVEADGTTFVYINTGSALLYIYMLFQNIISIFSAYNKLCSIRQIGEQTTKNPFYSISIYQIIIGLHIFKKQK